VRLPARARRQAGSVPALQLLPPLWRARVHPRWRAAAVRRRVLRINLGALDDATDEELAQAPIHFADGRHDKWEAVADATKYL